MRRLLVGIAALALLGLALFGDSEGGTWKARRMGGGYTAWVSDTVYSAANAQASYPTMDSVHAPKGWTIAGFQAWYEGPGTDMPETLDVYVYQECRLRDQERSFPADTIRLEATDTYSFQEMYSFDITAEKLVLNGWYGGSGDRITGPWGYIVYFIDAGNDSAGCDSVVYYPEAGNATWGADTKHTGNDNTKIVFK